MKRPTMLIPLIALAWPASLLSADATFHLRLTSKNCSHGSLFLWEPRKTGLSGLGPATRASG